MSALFLVRHGQASSLTQGDYDKLSPLGHVQARVLGEHLRTSSWYPERVYVGPRRRHRETCGAAMGVMANDASSSGPVIPLADLDEHPGVALFRHAVPRLLNHPDHGEVARSLKAGEQPPAEALFRAFRYVMRMWSRDELNAPGMERWSEFMARVERAVVSLTAEPCPRVLAFSSGGAIGAMVGRVLGLDAERCLELGWVIRNGSLTELRFQDGRIGLVRFNDYGFLDPKDQVTLV